MLRLVRNTLDEATVLKFDHHPVHARWSDPEVALLVATACSKPPAGRARWTLTLLADEMIRLTGHSSVSPETIRRRLVEKD